MGWVPMAIVKAICLTLSFDNGSLGNKAGLGYFSSIHSSKATDSPKDSPLYSTKAHNPSGFVLDTLAFDVHF